MNCSDQFQVLCMAIWFRVVEIACSELVVCSCTLKFIHGYVFIHISLTDCYYIGIQDCFTRYTLLCNIVEWCCISWSAIKCSVLYVSTSYRVLVIHTYLITINLMDKMIVSVTSAFKGSCWFCYCCWLLCSGCCFFHWICSAEQRKM